VVEEQTGGGILLTLDRYSVSHNLFTSRVFRDTTRWVSRRPLFQRFVILSSEERFSKYEQKKIK